MSYLKATNTSGMLRYMSRGRKLLLECNQDVRDAEIYESGLKIATWTQPRRPGCWDIWVGDENCYLNATKTSGMLRYMSRGWKLLPKRNQDVRNAEIYVVAENCYLNATKTSGMQRYMSRGWKLLLERNQDVRNAEIYESGLKISTWTQPRRPECWDIWVGAENFYLNATKTSGMLRYMSRGKMSLQNDFGDQRTIWSESLLSEWLIVVLGYDFLRKRRLIRLCGCVGWYVSFWVHMSFCRKHCALAHISSRPARILSTENKCIGLKKVREKSRECHNHKPTPFPDTKETDKSKQAQIE